MAYAFRKCPTFNRWSPCSASLLSALAVSCRHQCPSLVDAQRLSLLGSFLHRLSSTSGYLIEWLMPFTGIRHSTNGYRAVFDCILPRQSRVDAYALARWTHNVFCSLGVSYTGFLPPAVAGSNGLCHSLVSGVQPMVTVQCFTAFCPGRVV